MSVEHAGNGTRLAVGPGVAEEGPLPSPRAGDAAKRRGGGVASGAAEGCAARCKIDLVQRDTPPLECPVPLHVPERRHASTDVELVVQGNIVTPEIRRQQGRRGELARRATAQHPTAEILRHILTRRPAFDTTLCQSTRRYCQM